MQIQEGQLVLNSRETLFKVNEIKNNLAYCEICSTADHRRVLNLPEIRPYFLQLGENFKLVKINPLGKTTVRTYRVKSIFYYDGGLVFNAVNMTGGSEEFSEKEILENIVL